MGGQSAFFLGTLLPRSTLTRTVQEQTTLLEVQAERYRVFATLPDQMVSRRVGF
jgi:hypothetical protein